MYVAQQEPNFFLLCTEVYRDNKSPQHAVLLMIITTITELLSTGSSLSLGVPVGVSVAASSIVMFSLGALTASLVCLLCNLRRSRKANITITGPANTTARTHSPDPVYEAPDDVVDQIEMKENAIYTNMGQRYGGPPSSSRH